MANAQSRINSDTKAVYVFGSGEFANKIVLALQDLGIEILGVLDKPEYAGKAVGGLPVGSFQLAEATDTPVLIAVHNSFARIVDIEASLWAQGLRATYTPPQIAGFLATLGKPIENYWLSSSDSSFLNPDQVSELASMLSDQKSLDLLNNQLNYRRTGQSEFLQPPLRLGEQYFPSDVPEFFDRLEDMGGFVDLGAYQGDTLDALQTSKLSPEVYVGLEPDLNNMALLLSKSNSFPGKKLIFNFAAHSSLQTLEITSSGPSSAIQRGGGTRVQAAPLDILTWGIKVSYIKMDIEGSESEALLGSKALIARDKPVLAISVYHKPDDLLTIPRIIKSFGVYDKFFLRCYGDQTFDTVLYCLPS
jgi:FkbM family methyltransferase